MAGNASDLIMTIKQYHMKPVDPTILITPEKATFTSLCHPYETTIIGFKEHITRP